MKELDDFTVERLERLIAIAAALGCATLDGSEVAALARIALAAKTAKPVAYVTFKGYLIHAGDPRLSEYSNPGPLYDIPVPRYSPEILDSRKAFEKLYESGDIRFTYNREYAWEWWKLSRENLVVDLPDEDQYANNPHGHGRNQGISECTQTILDNGIKIKGKGLLSE